MMRTQSIQGYLVLADISGYTAYLAGAELDHAQNVLAELMELIVDCFQPLLTLSKLEGDAVFAYTPSESVARGETLLEILESTYLAFRDRIQSIRRKTTCQCNACRSIPNLDLKFIVHYGEFVLQNVAGTTELVGTDVNLAHRLMKNHVSEMTGWKAYILLTGASLAGLNLNLNGLHEGSEQYEHLGETKFYSLDLQRRYEELLQDRAVLIPPETADFVVSRPFDAPPMVVWDWMNDIQKRLKWEQFDDIRPVVRPGGRMGAGARNHCAHGKNIVTETVLDWHPFEHYTIEYPLATQSRYLKSTPNGTDLTICSNLNMKGPRTIRRTLARLMARLSKLDQQLEKLGRSLAEDKTQF